MTVLAAGSPEVQPIEGAAVQTAGNTCDVRGSRGSEAMERIEDAMQVHRL